MPKGAHPKPPKLTAQEVMSLHGLTVEQAIAKGYDVALAEKKATWERQLRRRQEKIIQLNYKSNLGGCQ